MAAGGHPRVAAGGHPRVAAGGHPPGAAGGSPPGAAGMGYRALFLVERGQLFDEVI